MSHSPPCSSPRSAPSSASASTSSFCVYLRLAIPSLPLRPLPPPHARHHMHLFVLRILIGALSPVSPGTSRGLYTAPCLLEEILWSEDPALTYRCHLCQGEGNDEDVVGGACESARWARIRSSFWGAFNDRFIRIPCHKDGAAQGAATAWSACYDDKPGADASDSSVVCCPPERRCTNQPEPSSGSRPSSDAEPEPSSSGGIGRQTS